MMNESYELTNGVTGTLSVRVSRFTDGTKFKTLSNFNHFTVILFEKGSGRLVVDASPYTFDGGSLMSFSLYQPFQATCESPRCPKFITSDYNACRLRLH